MDGLIDPLAIGLNVIRFMGSGKEVLVSCPYHSDSHPSSTFNVELGLFHCFSCGTSKNAFQLAADLDGEIVQFENVRTFSAMNKIPYKEAKDDSWEMWLNYPFAIKNRYLDGRQVTPTQVFDFQIKAFNDGIIFPMRNASRQIIGVQTRWLSGDRKYIFFGSRPPVWPMERLGNYLNYSHKTGRPLYIVEGIFGVLRLNYYSTQAVASMSASAIKEAVQVMGFHKAIRGIFDADEAGYLAAAKLTMCGIPCFYGGIEADEVDLDGVMKIRDPNNFSTNPQDFADLSVSPGKVMKQAILFRKAVYG